MSAIFKNQQLKITWTCKDADTGDVINLSADTVKIHVRSPAGTEYDYSATMDDATNGVCSYTFATDVLAVEGPWEAKPYIVGSKTPGTVYRFNVVSEWSA